MAGVNLAIRPWTFERGSQPTILEQLERVNRERGHFREITTSKLQEELATDGALQLSDDEDSDDASETADNDKEADTQPRSREELFQIRNEMLQKVSIAHNEVMMALDFVSLAESKDNASGRQTTSQFLKDNVPAGTLGTDVWQRMPKDAARDEQDAALAYNVRMSALLKSADNILGAAKTLESKVKKETRYWNEVLSVTEAGWNVCRIPGQRQKLGVRFGFNESGPEFNRGGIAALESTEDGSVVLDREVETRSKVAHVTIRNGHTILGSSSSVPLVDSGSVESEIKAARDSLFDAELFREIEREARTLIPMGVTMHDNAIVYPLTYASTEVKVSMELLTHEQAAGRVSGASAFDFLAQGVLSICKLLLCQAHRDNLSQRSKIPAPMAEARPERRLLPIVRPLLFLASHHAAIDAINKRLTDAANAFDKANTSTRVVPAQHATSLASGVEDFTGLLTGLLQPASSTAALHITPVAEDQAERTLTIKCQPLISDRSTIFIVQVSDEPATEGRNIMEALWLVDRALEDIAPEKDT